MRQNLTVVCDGFMLWARPNVWLCIANQAATVYLAKFNLTIFVKLLRLRFALQDKLRIMRDSFEV